jgi:hypothetical protein
MESIGAAWARLSSLAQSSPDLSIPDHMLLKHFCLGPSKESTLYLDIAARGSFTHKTPAEGREILDKIMENTSFVRESEPLQVEAKVQHEEALATESEFIEIQSIDSTPSSSAETESLKGEEIQPLEFYDLFKDFGNTSDYFYQKRPPVPITPTELSKKEFLRETIKQRMAERGTVVFETSSNQLPFLIHLMLHQRPGGGSSLQPHRQS